MAHSSIGGMRALDAIIRANSAPLIKRNYYLIRADEAQVLAHQLVGHVGIGLARIEQMRAMPHLRALLFQLRKLRLPFLERAMVAAPCKQSVRPGYRMTRECPDDQKSQRGQRRTADQSKAFRRIPHRENERITPKSPMQGEMDRSVSISWKKL